MVLFFSAPLRLCAMHGFYSNQTSKTFSSRRDAEAQRKPHIVPASPVKTENSVDQIASELSYLASQLIQLSQRLIEVGYQVLHIFETHRQADQSVGNPSLFAFGGRHVFMGDGRPARSNSPAPLWHGSARTRPRPGYWCCAAASAWAGSPDTGGSSRLPWAA